MKDWLKASLIIVLVVTIIFVVSLTSCIGCADYASQDLTESQLNYQTNIIFEGDDLKRLAVYPSRKVRLKKGSELSPLGFSIRNTKNQTTTFNFALEFTESDCGINPATANNLIILRRTGAMTVLANSFMEDAVLFEFKVPEDFPSCLMGYNLIVTDDNGSYAKKSIMVEIIEK